MTEWKPRHHCWLCMSHRWDPKTGRPELVEYRTFSSEPWHTSRSRGWLHSALYVTEGPSFHEALLTMLRTVVELAKMDPVTWGSIHQALVNRGSYREVGLAPDGTMEDK